MLFLAGVVVAVIMGGSRKYNNLKVVFTHLLPFLWHFLFHYFSGFKCPHAQSKPEINLFVFAAGHMEMRGELLRAVCIHAFLP